MEIVLNCDCAVDTFVFRDDFLVLDIKDGPPLPDSGQPQYSYRLSGLPSERLQDWPNRINYRFGTLLSPILTNRESTAIDQPVLLNQGVDLSLADVLFAQNIAQQLEVGAFLGDELLSDLRLATTQNLVVQRNPNLPDAPVFSEFASGKDIALDLADHISTGTSLIDGLEQALSVNPKCISEAVFWPSEDNDMANFSNTIGAYRRDASREGRSAEDIANLAKAYLYFGFGAEARQLVQMNLSDERDAAILIAIADVIDRGYSPQASAIVSQIDCDGMIPLWSYLAQPNTDLVPSSTGYTAVTSAFSNLPPHLRKHLGPMLIERFADAGLITRAEQVRRLMRSGLPDTMPEPIIADVTLEDAEGDTENAEKILIKLANGNFDDSAQALAQLVQRKAERLEPLLNEDVDLLDSYLTQYKGSALESELLHAKALALALAQNFVDAVELLESEDLTESGAGGSVFQILGAIGNDVDLLAIMIPNSRLSKEFWKDERVLEAANRLINLGFSSDVYNRLIHPFSGEQEEKRRLLRAEAALDMGAPNDVLRVVQGLTSEEANLLRAKAYELGENTLDAQILYARLGAQFDADRLKYRQSDPAAAPISPVELLGRDTGEIPIVPDEGNPLDNSSIKRPDSSIYASLTQTVEDISQLEGSEVGLDVTVSQANSLKQKSEQAREIIAQLLDQSQLNE